MFLKRCERRKSGKKHTYWLLVESYRTPRGSRHRVVAYLGGLSRGEASGWSQLGRTLSGKRRTRPEPSLFDPPHYDELDDDEPVLVKLRDIHLQRLRSFGDVWLAWGSGGYWSSMSCYSGSCPGDAKRSPGTRWPPSLPSPGSASRPASCISRTPGIAARPWMT